jgi:hypothetical protein
MDVARIGLEADSKPIERATHELDQFTNASKRADQANDQRSASHRSSVPATAAATAATQANTMALRAQASASGAAAFRQRMLAVQSLDVAQSLALGMPPMMVAIQQGGQIAGIYAGQGGVAGAFREATQSVLGFARANPIAIAASAALAAGVFGLKRSLEQSTGTAVTFGETIGAAFRVAADGVMSVLSPAIAAISPQFQIAWAGATNATSTAINSIIGFGVGVVKVSGTTNYEQQVTDDDDIPNKRYVDDAIIANPSFQIVRSDTRVTAFDPVGDPLDFLVTGAIGPYVNNPSQSEIAVIVNDRLVALFTENQVEVRGLSIIWEDNKGSDIGGFPASDAITLQATNTNTNIKLETNGTGKVQITYAMQFDNSGIAPAAVTDTTVVYAGPDAAGTSGLYTVNDNYRDELVTKGRALLFSMIF